MNSAADRSFFWRRLHSFSGIFPVGAFLLEHLYTNFYATRGPAAYNARVQELASLPVVLALETVFIYIPIAFHGLYGVWIWWRGDSNVSQYPWRGNWFYSAQRWTGLIAMVYIGFHVWEQRFAGAHILTHPYVAFSKVQHSIADPAVGTLYLVGLMAACFHFSYGVWLFSCKWGFVPGVKAQQKLLWACAGLFLVLSGAGLASLRSFFTTPEQRTPEELIQMHGEEAMQGQRAAQGQPAMGNGQGMQAQATQGDQTSHGRLPAMQKTQAMPEQAMHGEQPARGWQATQGEQATQPTLGQPAASGPQAVPKQATSGRQAAEGRRAARHDQAMQAQAPLGEPAARGRQAAHAQKARLPAIPGAGN